MTTQPTPAETRLAQYADRSTWTNATYSSGTEKALHEIALGLKAEVDRLRSELAKEQRLHGDTIDDRDRAQDAADKLAYAIAPEQVIGEHSADNSPWANALELVTSKADVDKLRAELADQIRYAAALEAHLCQCEPLCESGEYLHAADCPVVDIQMQTYGGPADEETHVVADDSDDPDSLPAWLANRFDPNGAPRDGMSDDDRAYWEHHARAVRRAVARGGFKPEGDRPAAVGSV